LLLGTGEGSCPVLNSSLSVAHWPLKNAEIAKEERTIENEEF
jgi:hypothetical protein